MIKENDVPKEIKKYEKLIKKSYEDTEFCNVCHIKKAIDGSCLCSR